jgi:paraquat-inducible protein A
MSAVADSLRECGQCGLISVLPAQRLAFIAECPRCEHRLWRMKGGDFRFSIACGMAATLFYVFALAAPFLEISAYGRFQLANIRTGPITLAAQGFDAVALLVAAVTIIFPGLKLAILLITLLSAQHHMFPRRVCRFLFRWYGPLSPWAMIDVYLLGFLVAYSRLTGMAQVHLDTALYALIGMMVCLAAAESKLDPEAVWRALDQSAPMDVTAPYTGCHHCGILNSREAAQCRRCEGVLHPRKPNSVMRSWSFLIAAACLYIPANLYPVMDITQAARLQDFTIFGGIAELMAYGLWPLAGLVFLASIVIPLSKILMLGALLIRTQLHSPRRLLPRTRAFRFIDFIGRWSMIDVFMISILVALVRFGAFANVQADTGAPCFAAVVVLTMFAVETFDPRLMWDHGVSA